MMKWNWHCPSGERQTTWRLLTGAASPDTIKNNSPSLGRAEPFPLKFLCARAVQAQCVDCTTRMMSIQGNLASSGASHCSQPNLTWAPRCSMAAQQSWKQAWAAASSLASDISTRFLSQPCMKSMQWLYFERSQGKCPPVGSSGMQLLWSRCIAHHR